MNLARLKLATKQLTPAQREKLSIWLQAVITSNRSKQKRSPSKSIGKMDGNNIEHRTYRKEMVRCGKEGCRCNDGRLHRPYWYAYWSENGKTKSIYIGK